MLKLSDDCYSAKNAAQPSKPIMLCGNGKPAICPRALSTKKPSHALWVRIQALIVRIKASITPAQRKELDDAFAQLKLEIKARMPAHGPVSAKQALKKPAAPLDVQARCYCADKTTPAAKSTSVADTADSHTVTHAGDNALSSHRFFKGLSSCVFFILLLLSIRCCIYSTIRRRGLARAQPASQEDLTIVTGVLVSSSDDEDTASTIVVVGNPMHL